MRTGTTALRCLLSAALLIAGGGASAGQQAQQPTAKEVTAAINAHFEKVPAELSRYDTVTLYGETLSATKPSPEAVAKEVALLKDATAAGMLKSPTREVLQLGHNVVIHDPSAGEAYLKAVIASVNPSDMQSFQALGSTILAAGEPGEAILIAAFPSMSNEQRRLWSRYLVNCALYASSVKGIQAQIAAESDPETKAALIRAISMIGVPSALPAVRELIEQTKDDKTQGAAIFAYVELAGFDGIPYLEKVKPIGPEATTQLKEGLSWLREDTSAKSKHGTEVENDSDFVERFGDLNTTPVIKWMNDQGLLKSDAVKHPKKLDADKKKALLELLVDSKGFGLEVAKGALFLSVAPEDEPLLAKIRAVSFYSPNSLSRARAKTIGILVRTTRQDR